MVVAKKKSTNWKVAWWLLRKKYLLESCMVVAKKKKYLLESCMVVAKKKGTYWKAAWWLLRKKVLTGKLHGGC